MFKFRIVYPCSMDPTFEAWDPEIDESSLEPRLKATIYGLGSEKDVRSLTAALGRFSCFRPGLVTSETFIGMLEDGPDLRLALLGALSYRYLKAYQGLRGCEL